MTSGPGRGARDFDFLHGRWKVHNRRLTERLKGGTTWEEFDASLEVRPALEGLGNVDQFRTTIQGRPFEGMTLRLFNPASEEWSLYWVDSVTPILQPPLVGRFRDGRGEFFTDDRFEGKPIRIRFLWIDCSERSGRWEQAFSADGGATWETNWVMEFTRPKDDP